MTPARQNGWGDRPPSLWRDQGELVAFLVGLALAVVVTVIVLSPHVGGGR